MKRTVGLVAIIGMFISLFLPVITTVGLFNMQVSMAGYESDLLLTIPLAIIALIAVVSKSESGFKEGIIVVMAILSLCLGINIFMNVSLLMSTVSASYGGALPLNMLSALVLGISVLFSE